MTKLIANIVDGILRIDIPVNDPLFPSKSKKTLLVASSGRPQKTNAMVDGKPVYINLNAYVYPS